MPGQGGDLSVLGFWVAGNKKGVCRSVFAAGLNALTDSIERDKTIQLSVMYMNLLFFYDTDA